MTRTGTYPYGAKLLAMPLALTLAISLAACGGAATTTSDDATTETIEEAPAQDDQTEAEAEPDAAQDADSQADEPSTFSLTRDDLTIQQTVSDDADESHAITADGTTDSYANLEVLKTGSADGDEADFYGTNAAVYATNGATLDLSGVYVNTSGTHANAVFSYGEGTTLSISDSVIETDGNCSGGIMVTGGGTLNATNLAIHTTGNSSAAIRSDRGGGTQNVNGGSYVTDGVGSPVIYSTADVYVSDAALESTSSQGVVVEGKNSVTLTNCDLIANNVSKNSDKSAWYQAMMIYQSMSGDAAEGEASFTMEGGSLTNRSGDVFFVNNTVATINLASASIVNEDASGVFMRLAAAGWGSEGSNGGHVTLNASGQAIDGDILVDSVSELNAYLRDGSTLASTVNPDNEGSVYMEIESGSTWVLTGDSYVTSLTCDADAINLNGHTLYVNGVAYEEGTASMGSAIEFTLPTGGGMGGMGGPGGGEPPAKPGE